MHHIFVYNGWASIGMISLIKFIYVFIVLLDPLYITHANSKSATTMWTKSYKMQKIIYWTFEQQDATNWSCRLLFCHVLNFCFHFTMKPTSRNCMFTIQKVSVFNTNYIDYELFLDISNQYMHERVTYEMIIGL